MQRWVQVVSRGGEVVVAAALLGQAVSGRSEDKKVGLGETGRNPS
jgi:hypothetical protein